MFNEIMKAKLNLKIWIPVAIVMELLIAVSFFTLSLKTFIAIVPVLIFLAMAAYMDIKRKSKK